MNSRERLKACLNYEAYGRLPIVHFGFWEETLQKWRTENHVPENDSVADVTKRLGFDFGWADSLCFTPKTDLHPFFDEEIIKKHPDGSIEMLSREGVVIMVHDGVTSIPMEVDHLLKNRDAWEEHYLPKLQFSEDRINQEVVYVPGCERPKPFNRGGREYLLNAERDYPYGLYCGSLFGVIRNWLGVEGSAYLQVDDEGLFDEIINTVGELCYRTTEYMLNTGIEFDYAHLWEDICFKTGPLISPTVFDEKVGPWYKRISKLLNKHGIDVISVDCDGMIDALVPTWLNSGINTMFPIEVGTWHASIAPWREKYGKKIRGVGGMNKNVFAGGFKAIDQEIERLKPLIELGAYIPCPDHRIPPDANWDSVRYYCDCMRKSF